MATGMDMMVQTLLRAFGVDPKTVMNDVEMAVRLVQTGIAEINQNLKEINARLDRLENHLGVAKENTIEILPPERRIANQ